MIDAIVVGAGIIGATVAKSLIRQGLTVKLIDDGRPNAGTPPSGGHLKPSWFGGMPKTEYEPAMELLNVCWGVKEERFTIRDPITGMRIKRVSVFRVDTDLVTAMPRTVGRVTRIDCLDSKYPRVTWDGQEERCRLLVVATGVWAAELVPEVTPTPKQGVSFRLKGTIKEPTIIPWAPYKQIVAHQQNEGEIWVGDGSAILPANWGSNRTAECRTRCVNAILRGVDPGGESISGLRPYLDGLKKSDPCYLRKIGPNVWIATGAGKSGTIAAGWAARSITTRIV